MLAKASIVVAVVFTLAAIAVAQTEKPITDLKMLAGTWNGWYNPLLYEPGPTRRWLKLKQPGWTVAEDRWQRRISAVQEAESAVISSYDRRARSMLRLSRIFLAALEVEQVARVRSVVAAIVET